LEKDESTTQVIFNLGREATISCFWSDEMTPEKPGTSRILKKCTLFWQGFRQKKNFSKDLTPKNLN
jgi:hypothetical protein